MHQGRWWSGQEKYVQHNETGLCEWRQWWEVACRHKEDCWKPGCHFDHRQSACLWKEIAPPCLLLCSTNKSPVCGAAGDQETAVAAQLRHRRASNSRSYASYVASATPDAEIVNVATPTATPAAEQCQLEASAQASATGAAEHDAQQPEQEEEEEVDCYKMFCIVSTPQLDWKCTHKQQSWDKAVQMNEDRLFLPEQVEALASFKAALGAEK